MSYLETLVLILLPVINTEIMQEKGLRQRDNTALKRLRSAQGC
jgi:hypothetical protein